MKTTEKTNKQMTIHEVINMNGKKTTCKFADGTRLRFSFTAAKKHFTSGFLRKINEIEGKYISLDANKTLAGIAQQRHNAISDNERQNKAFLLCRTALQKGKLPKGYKEKDIKEVCFSALFVEALAKCECRTGYNTDKLLSAVSKEIAMNRKAKAKKSNKK